MGIEREPGKHASIEHSGDELHRCDKGKRQIKDEVWGWVSNLVMEYLEVACIFKKRKRF